MSDPISHDTDQAEGSGRDAMRHARIAVGGLLLLLAGAVLGLLISESAQSSTSPRAAYCAAYANISGDAALYRSAGVAEQQALQVASYYYRMRGATADDLAWAAQVVAGVYRLPADELGDPREFAGQRRAECVAGRVIPPDCRIERCSGA